MVLADSERNNGGWEEMSFIVPLDIPKTCLECFLLSEPEYIGVGNGLYKRISRCRLAPENIQDPYRKVEWFCDNKEKWCPLKEIEGE